MRLKCENMSKEGSFSSQNVRDNGNSLRHIPTGAVFVLLRCPQIVLAPFSSVTASCRRLAAFFPVWNPSPVCCSITPSSAQFQTCQKSGFNPSYKTNPSSQIVYNLTNINIENYLLVTANDFIRNRQVDINAQSESNVRIVFKHAVSALIFAWCYAQITSQRRNES